MRAITFLQKSLAQQLSWQDQVNFLRSSLDITAQELADGVLFLRDAMPMKPCLPEAIDVCGTGGSGLPKMNTSTLSALILARHFKIGVAKHGNRAVSGQCGSFDLLDGLGISYSHTIETIEARYAREKIAFLFAPLFHPVLKKFSDLRKKIGKPTFFNLLGPLLNPACPKRQIIGTAFRDKMQLLAETCRLLKLERAYIVCAEKGLDEVSLSGYTDIVELCDGQMTAYTIHPEDFGLTPVPFGQVVGGSIQENVRIAQEILAGKTLIAHLDLVYINVALALKLVDRVKTLKEGYLLASTFHDVPSILAKIVHHKRFEVAKAHTTHATPAQSASFGLPASTRSFAKAICGRKKLAIIAEIKRASPSMGKISHAPFSCTAIAKNYVQSGAHAISVLCDTHFFKGSLAHLRAVSDNTSGIPLLCKDFIIDPRQIYQARAHGADAILLIASLLTQTQLQTYIDIAKSLHMEALCEVHTKAELDKVLGTSARIIGMNNRDLHTFQVNLATTYDLLPHIPKDKIIVSESGFHSSQDVDTVRGSVDAILVGTALMQGMSIREILGAS